LSAPERATVESLAEGVLARPATAVLPNVIAGSHDPLLEWALGARAPVRRFLAGLERLANRRAGASGVHVIDSDTQSYNVPDVRARLPREPVVVLEWGLARAGPGASRA
jgi:hypothetical protein